MLTVTVSLLLFSLLPVQSFDCLYGLDPYNSTKAFCKVGRGGWCYSVQSTQSKQSTFRSRGCDDKRVICEKLQAMGRWVVQLQPNPPLSFDAHSFCYEVMNQTICCCDKDNCNTGKGGEIQRKYLALSHSTSHLHPIHLLPLLIVTIVA